MGQIGANKKLQKKYKNVIASRDLIDDALDLDKKLKSISSHLKDFEKVIDPVKDKDQKKIREF